MREQRGYLFHKGDSWFVRYYRDAEQPDGSKKRIQDCEKLKVPYGGEYTTKKSVRPFVQEFLAPFNAGIVSADSFTLVSEFVDKIYLPEHVEKKLRAATLKQYRDVWNNHLKPRMGKLTLRGFRTVHGENMLAQIAAQAGLGRSSLRHCKAFLSGAFKQAKRLGILDGLNPIQDVSIPRAPEPEDTHAHDLAEIKAILAVLPEPAWTVVLTAALTGFRKGEIRGLTWADFTGTELSVRRSVWNSVVNEPKTRRSSAAIPVVLQLADALNAHKRRADKLAQPNLPIFQAGNGKPLNLDNLVRRVIQPAIEKCTVCRKPKQDHPTEGHMFQLDESLCWHGWHAFRRGLATNLHALGVEDREIQAILRHSNIGITQAIYIKSVSESQVSAMDALSEKLGICNDHATPATKRIQ